MVFEYNWKNKEANFGKPLEKEVEGGTHIVFEIILKRKNEYIALRRPEGIPEHGSHEDGTKNIFFCHNLIRYGESVEDCVKRIVKEQAGVNVSDYRVINIDSLVKDNNWAFVPHVIAEVDEIPIKGVYGNEVSEIIVFEKKNIPDDFAWWASDELRDFLEELD